MPNIFITPAALARARAVALDPGSVGCHPALIGGAWATLKAARGQTVDSRRLTPAHLIEPAAPPFPPAPAPETRRTADAARRAGDSEADIISQTYARTLAVIQSVVARRRHGEGGAA